MGKPPEIRGNNPLNNSSYGQAATQKIPGSVHQYVTGVREESQRTHSLKDDGDLAGLTRLVIAAVSHQVFDGHNRHVVLLSKHDSFRRVRH